MASHMRFRAILILIMLLAFPGAGWSGPARNIIQGESLYSPGKGGSGPARLIALHMARRAAWMSIGLEISRFHDVQMLKMEGQQLAHIAAASVRPETKEEIRPDGTVRITALVRDDPRHVALAALRLKDESTVLHELSRNWKRGEDALPPAKGKKGGEKESAVEAAARTAEAVDDYFLGWSLILSGDYPEAYSAFSRAVKSDPGHAQALCQRGFLSYLEGDSGRALADLDQAVRLEGNYAEAYYCRGLVHLQEGRCAQAVVEFDRALQWNPQHPYAAECRKSAFEKARHWTPDLAWFENTARSKPETGSARLGLGTALAALGRHRDAISEFNLAAKIEPLDVRVYIARGRSYASLGNFRRAVADYSRAIELNPRMADAFYLRGAAYLDSGNYRQAVIDLDRALELDPAYPEAAGKRTLAYQGLGKPKPDISYLDAAVSLHPEHPRNYILRGLAFWDSGRPKEAVEDFTKAIEKLEYEDPGMYLIRAAACASAGRRGCAVEDQEKLVEIAPEEYIRFGDILTRIPLHDTAEKVRAAFLAGGRSSAAVEGEFIFRGTCRIMTEDYERAISDFRKAIALNPKSRRGYLFMGIAHAILGNHELAAQNYGSALKADPGYALAYFTRSIALRNIRRNRESLADLKEASRLGLTAAAQALEEQGYKAPR